MKIIITGCAGFIGYHLTQKLSENKSYTISGIDSINNYYATRIKKKKINLLKKKKNFKFIKINLKKKKIDNIFKN